MLRGRSRAIALRQRGKGKAKGARQRGMSDGLKPVSSAVSFCRVFICNHLIFFMESASFPVKKNEVCFFRVFGFFKDPFFRLTPMLSNTGS